MPTVTVNIYRPGHPTMSDDGAPSTSSFGHMDATVQNGDEATTYGFAPIAPGSPIGPGAVTTSDPSHYIGKPDYSFSKEVSQEQYASMKNFGDHASQYPATRVGDGRGGDGMFYNTYNGATNSCIDFTFAMLGAGGLNSGKVSPSLLPLANAAAIAQIFGSVVPPELRVPSVDDLGRPYDPSSPLFGDGGAAGAVAGMGAGNQQISPLVLDLTGAGINLTALSAASPYFDIAGTGFARKTGWIGAGTGLLAIDRNGDGQINDMASPHGLLKTAR